MKNNFLLEMKSRGYLNQCTDLDNLAQISEKKSISGYIGFDCTAKSLHVGSLLQIMILKINAKTRSQADYFIRWWYYINWRPIRKRCHQENITSKRNSKKYQKYKKGFFKILDFSNKKTKPIFVDNAKWLTKLNYIKFLRDIGSHFTINKMLSFDSVKLRLERNNHLVIWNLII